MQLIQIIRAFRPRDLVCLFAFIDEHDRPIFDTDYNKINTRRSVVNVMLWRNNERWKGEVLGQDMIPDTIDK